MVVVLYCLIAKVDLYGMHLIVSVYFTGFSYISSNDKHWDGGVVPSDIVIPEFNKMAINAKHVDHISLSYQVGLLCASLFSLPLPVLNWLNVFNYFAVYPLQVEVGELKGRLNEVISNCDALCKRISSLGPEALGATITPFSPSIAMENKDSELTENKLKIPNSDV